MPADVRLPPTLSDAELQWRLLAAERLYALTNGLSTEPVDYFVDVRRGVSASEWSLLWLEDAQIVQTPATAVHGLVRYHQLFASLKGVGNMIDAMHATESVGCDFFVTSDENLAGILEAVRAETSGASPAPRWIQSGTVAPSALDAALH
jgi:hypothetical protein